MSHIAGPLWFEAGLSDVPCERQIIVENASIHYRSWGEAANASVVLVHGGLANSGWWDHIAPLLTGRHVVALDLSGNGDSDHRDVYDARQWAREIAAVAEHAGLDRPVVVGHSMGGVPAVATAADFPDRVSGVITVDSRFNDQDWPPRNKKSTEYATVEDGVRDFTPFGTVPGVTVDPSLIRHIAEASLRQTGDVWRWKRDDVYAVQQIPLRDLLPDVKVPLAIIRTEYGLVSADAAAEMRTLTSGHSVDLTIPAAGHNPMLEQPVALASVLRTLLALWWPADSTGITAHSEVAPDQSGD